MKSSTRSPESRILVLIGFAEALAAPEVAWSLIDAGHVVAAFSRRKHRAALRHSRHVAVHDIAAPEADLNGSLADLTSLLRSFEGQCTRRVLLPLDDAALLLCSALPDSAGWTLAGPRGERSELALDKRVQIACASRSGFDVPETWVASSVDRLFAAVRSFPVILRPALAAHVDSNRIVKGRNWICADHDELCRAAAAWNGRYPLLVQPFLSGSGEGVFGLATRQGVVACSAHRRLRMMNPHGSGSSACIARPVPEDARRAVDAFILGADWRGLFMIELLRTRDDHLWFVEFNGRAWGSMALSREQSLEYPAWTVSLAAGASEARTPASPATEPVVCRNLGRELVHVLFVLRGPKSRAIRDWPPLWRTLCSLLIRPRGSKSSFYNWRRDDWMVFVSDCWYTIRNQLVKPH